MQVCDPGVAIEIASGIRPVTLSGPQRVSAGAFAGTSGKGHHTLGLLAREHTASVAGTISVPQWGQPKNKTNPEESR